MNQTGLGNWMFKNLKLTKVPSKAAVSKMLRKEEFHRIKPFATDTNHFMLQKKSTIPSQFPQLEDKLFAWFRRIEMKHGVLTDDLVRAKALEYAADSELGLPKFQASGNWVRRFKKRHGIDEKVRHGEGGSTDQVYVAIAQAGISLRTSCLQMQKQ
jgi:hypothetical protein